MVGHFVCCVVGCNNTWRNSKCQFFAFPTSKFALDQRNKWIIAVRREKFDKSTWTPRTFDRICNTHFIGGVKSKDPISPSYCPSIFPSIYKKRKLNAHMAQNRYNRLMNKNKRERNQFREDMDAEYKKDFAETASALKNQETLFQEELRMDVDNAPFKISAVDKETQVTFLNDHTEITATFTCNTFVINNVCEVQIQTEIYLPNDSITKIILHKERKSRDKACNTEEKTLVDALVGDDEPYKCPGFLGYESVKNDTQLSELAGVDSDTFEFLLKRLNDNSNVKNSKVDKKNRLLIFLMVLKHALKFSGVGVLFGLHRSTISRIFHSVLDYLSASTSNLVFWPNKDIVQNTMPQCFRKQYSNTRVVIDCTEFRIEIPPGVDKRNYCYSQYKSGFTAKVLIGITPAGFISFVSKVAGGRKSDCQLTVESGLLDLLEEDDMILADKGFPGVQTRLSSKNKKVLVVMPPYLKGKQAFTHEETAETYNIAKVRIHVERIMQRLRLFNILNKVPSHFFDCMDKIIHICCVLVNLQPPIINEEDEA